MSITQFIDLIPQEILFNIAAKALNIPIEEMEQIQLSNSIGNYLKFKLKTKYEIKEFSVKL